MNILRSAFGARRPEQESLYIVTIACRMTERERDQICRRRRHKSQAAISAGPDLHAHLHNKFVRTSQ